MMIRVLYQNGKFDMVKDVLLGLYIASGKIAKFGRRRGWAIVGIDPIRGIGCHYIGPERRHVA